jgi:hypothetical protein
MSTVTDPNAIERERSERTVRRRHGYAVGDIEQIDRCRRRWRPSEERPRAGAGVDPRSRHQAGSTRAPCEQDGGSEDTKGASSLRGVRHNAAESRRAIGCQNGREGESLDLRLRRARHLYDSGHTEQRRYGGIRSHHQRHRSGGDLVAARSTLWGGSPEPMAVLQRVRQSNGAMGRTRSIDRRRRRPTLAGSCGSTSGRAGC